MKNVYLQIETRVEKYREQVLDATDLRPTLHNLWKAIQGIPSRCYIDLVDERGRVWLNPPFGKDAIPFLARMVEHVKNGGSGIVLLFARTDNKAWHEFIFPHAKGIFFMRKRIRFCGLDGVAMSSSPMPSALIAFTWQDVDALQRFSESNEGHLVTL